MSVLKICMVGGGSKTTQGSEPGENSVHLREFSFKILHVCFLDRYQRVPESLGISASFRCAKSID